MTPQIHTLEIRRDTKGNNVLMTDGQPEKEAELIAAEAALKARVHPAVPGVYACIVKVSGEIAKEGIAKTRTNQQQGYKFRGIDDVQDALAPILSRHGLVILPRCLYRHVVERQTQKGGTLFYVTVEAEFDFVCAADASMHTVRMYGEAMDSADKATNKAMSAAYKYAACQTFCIPTKGDDADATTHEITAAPARPAAIPPHRDERENPAAPNGGEIGAIVEPHWPATATGEDRGTLPDGAVFIERVDSTATKNPKVTRYLITTSSGEQIPTIKDKIAELAQECYRDRLPVFIKGKAGKFGLEVDTLMRADEPPF